MGTMEHQDEDVICEDSAQLDQLPQWAPAFRAICVYLRQEGLIDELEKMDGLGRRADAYRLIDGVMFLVAYFCANPSEGGLREFWYDIRQHHEKLGAWYGRDAMPSSSSISRMLEEVEPEDAAEFGQWALGDATDLGMTDRPAAKWLDSWGDGWHVVDWDPKARLVRQRTLVDGEDYPEPKRYGPEHGAVGRQGRKRGELKFVRGLMAHAGTSQWVGAYSQEGNGTLVEEMDIVGQARQRLAEQVDGLDERPPIVRIDGEGGEVCVINGVEEAGWCPLVRLKQYKLLERSDVRRAIADQEPTRAEGGGTGPVREVFEIGDGPLTSNRQVDEVHRWDEAIEIRLVVTRYPETDADQGPGKLIDGMRYEMFGTYLPRKKWPAEAVVDLYFGRATPENRFAAADRELQLGKMFSWASHDGQHLATLVGLWAWNLMVEIGDRLVDEVQIPPQARRGPTADPREVDSTEAPEASAKADIDSQGPSPVEVIGEEDGQATLEASTLERLDRMGISYRPKMGVLECSAGHYLNPIKSGKKDLRSTRFRIDGRACRGCRHRSRCTSSTHPNFRKEVTIPNDQVPAALQIRDGDRRAPLGVDPPDGLRAGPLRVRRPGFLGTKRRRQFRRAARKAQLKVTLNKGDPEPVAACARAHLRYRRTRQRLPDRMRRRYRRLSAQATMTCHWKGDTELGRAMAG